MRYKQYILTLLLAVVTCLTASRVCYAAEAEIVGDSIVEATNADQPFDMDKYYEELAKAYGGKEYEKYQAMRERLNEDEQLREERQQKREKIQWMIIVLSLLVALIPTIAIVKKVLKGELQPAGKTAVLKTIGVLFFYGVLLFGLNYGWLWATFIGDSKLKGLLPGVLLLALVVYALYTINKSNKKKNNTNNSK